MANAYVAAWTACIKELQGLVSTAGAAQREVPGYDRAVELSKQLQPLPHAAWKELVQDVQATAKLANVCAQALRMSDCDSRSDSIQHIPIMAFTALVLWLEIAVATMRRSLRSQTAAAVRQQLQDSQLLQHLGPAMDAAAARLTAAVAALAATTTSSSGGSTSTAVSTTRQQDSMQRQVSRVEKADELCGWLLKAFHMTSNVLPLQARFSFEAALPFAPAAMRLILTGSQTCSQLQQLWQQQKEQLPLQVGNLAAVRNSFFTRFNSLPLALPAAVYSDSLQSTPAGRELLLSHDFLSCLAFVLVVTVLGLWLDTSSDGQTGASAIPAVSSSSAAGVGSSTGSGRQQQGQAGSSSSSGDSISSSVRLDSVAPLSCSLFDVLGVTKETVVQAARLAGSEGLVTVAEMETLGLAYGCVLKFQVNQAKGAFDAQLLLQLETYLLLSLTVMQLTDSIPDSHPWAQETRALAYQVCNCEPLRLLWHGCGLHKLPRPATYMGPQLALQLLPSPHDQQQSPPQLPQQEQQQQQQPPLPQKQEPAGWCMLAPAAPLLTELLPLLTRLGMKELQQQQEQEQEQQQQQQEQQQQQQEQGQQQQQPAACPMEQPSSTPKPALGLCLQALFTLLICSVPPAPRTASAGQPSPAAATAAAHGGQAATRDCVMHAQDAFLPHASSIISMFEAGLRLGAALLDAATAAAGSSTGDAAVCAAEAASAISAQMQDYGKRLCWLCCHNVTGTHPHHCAPLVKLALAAGPGSQVQHQLHSLLATMVKFSGRTKCLPGIEPGGVYRHGAVYAVMALLAGSAANNQQQQLAEAAGAGATDPSDGNVAAVCLLPNLVILGRCCMQWAEQLQAEVTLLQEEQELCSGQQQQPRDADSSTAQDYLQWGFIARLSVVQRWLAADSTCGQLTAAGCMPLPVLHQLEQLLPIDEPSPSDTAARLAAAQQLRSTGLALCSFPVPCMCNNPGCTSMEGLSELAAVSGRSCICGGCRVARYCGRACQREAWQQHKPVCAALSAAAAAGAPGAVVGAPLAA